MSSGRRTSGRQAFTLVELLVVISIIALLISILLPSLTRARDQAKSLKCGAQLHGLGLGLQTYGVENEEWIPGRNTTGFETWVASMPNAGVRMSQSHVPVQTFDWLTPILRVSTQLPANRAQRYRMLLEAYRCPSVNFKAAIYSTPAPPDLTLFQEDAAQHGAFFGVSYLMPVHFQHWGREDARVVLGFHPSAPTVLSFGVDFNPDYYEVRVNRYRSRIGRVGTPAEKIAIADGTRYLNVNNELTFDSYHNPQFFGSFTSAGGWWRGSTAYGVFPYSDSRGRNIPLTYRHYNGIEAAFFDGHAEYLSQRHSRKIDLWYPRGGVVVKANEGIDDYYDYANDYVIR